jgi:hypothetical protein
LTVLFPPERDVLVKDQTEMNAARFSLKVWANGMYAEGKLD